MATTARRRGLTAGTRSLRRVLTPLVAAVVIVVLWEASCRLFGIAEYILPAPSRVLDAFGENKTVLLTNTWPTLLESLLGFALGNGIAIFLAIVFVHFAPAERALMPVALFIRTIPIVAIAPVLVIMLGNGITPKVAIAALISFFPTLVNMVRGLNSVDRGAMELLRVLSASRTEVFMKVRIYASLPYLFASLKIATGNCVIGAIVAEWIGSQKGLGFLIIQATYNFLTPLLYATMVVTSGIAIVLYAVCSLIEKLVVRWEPEVQA
jgi:NitT/TauT family transport system permease protein